MSDIEKLAILADKADELLDLKAQMSTLQSEIKELKSRETRALNTKEVAQILEVSCATVVNWVNKGKIPALQSRNGYKYPANRIFAIAEYEARKRAEQHTQKEA